MNAPKTPAEQDKADEDQLTTARVDVAWFDVSNGVAGDMLLAALLDAGADIDKVRRAVQDLPVEGIDVRVDRVRRHGLRALKASVVCNPSTTHRTLPSILALLDASGVHPAPLTFANRVFRRLARAEADAHGISPDEVHFHEVGALDSIADILGVSIAAADLGLLGGGVHVTTSPIAVGAGSVQTEHGRLPVPAPAVLALLAQSGLPTAEHAATFELATPTGVALLAELVTGGAGPLPAATITSSGTGAGTADPAGHANVLRVVLGRTAPASATASPTVGPGTSRLADTTENHDWNSQDLLLVEATIDDLDPRIWPVLLEHAVAAGAADAWLTPVLMRKGRPGHLVTILARTDIVDGICVILFEQTTTLGVRIARTTRRHLDRDVVEVRIADHIVPVKRGLLNGVAVTVQPEFDETLTVAASTGKPLAQLITQASAAAMSHEATGQHHFSDLAHQAQDPDAHDRPATSTSSNPNRTGSGEHP